MTVSRRASVENSSCAPRLGSQDCDSDAQDGVRCSPGLPTSSLAVKSGFKRAETPLEFPLLASFFIRSEKISAARRKLVRAERILRADGNDSSEPIRRAPQTGAAQKAVLQAGAYHPLEVSIVELVALDGAHVFMRQVDPRNSLIIRRKRHWDAKHPVEHEGMIFSAHAKNHVVACQADFHH